MCSLLAAEYMLFASCRICDAMLSIELFWLDRLSEVPSMSCREERGEGATPGRLFSDHWQRWNKKHHVEYLVLWKKCYSTLI